MDNKKTYSTTKELLTNTPVPQQTRTYKPVSHEQLIDLTLESIYQAGFELDKELYTASSNGQIANGRFTISNVTDRDMQLQIGWQNSYNRQLTLKFAIGARIFICQNGCVSGDYGAFKKKHVGEVQTFAPTAIVDYIKAAGDAFQRMQKERDIMKTIEVSATRRAQIIGEMVIDKEMITPTQMNIISREIKRPTHDYDCENSLWELYQFTTFAMKEEHPAHWMDKHISAHQFFVNEAGILVPPTKEFEYNGPGNRKQLDLFQLV
jgi:hypothetical protein